MFTVGIDTGGTFTDCIVLDEQGNITEFKTPVTPADLSLCVRDALEKAATFYGRTIQQFLPEVELIVHGTTTATNALLTKTGAKTALITTNGFRDIIEIRRSLKSPKVSGYNYFLPPYVPLVPRHLRFTVDERTNYAGEIITPLNEDQLGGVIEKLKKEGVESLAICFIHSYANTENERKAAEICARELDEVYICTSHEILPVVGEHARENTCVISAYVGPILARYLNALEERLRGLNFKGWFVIIQSDQLCQSVVGAARKAVYQIMSGPAAAPAGGVYLGQVMGRPNLITIDMGGTSCDMGLIRNGEISFSTEKWLEEERVAIKMVDITGIGDGGGSIAWFDALGLLRVGPMSAGAEPGPACYGKGGQEPTVTDANVILGYVPDDYFMGGERRLNIDLAKSAAKKVADRLNMPVERAAHAIFAAVNSSMTDGITEITTKMGHDVRDFSLLVFGGAGPIHGAFLADALRIGEVIVPRFAATFSAWSMFTLDIGRDYARSYVIPAEIASLEIINRLYQDMTSEALGEFEVLGIPREEVAIAKSAEMRYMMQYHDVEVAGLPDRDLTPEDLAKVIKTFHRRHEELYTYCMPSFPVQLRNLRIIAKAKGAKMVMKEIAAGTEDASEALKRKRPCFFDDGYVETPIYDDVKLKSGNVIAGPAVIEHITTSVVIPKGFHCLVDKYGNYSIRR